MKVLYKVWATPSIEFFFISNIDTHFSYSEYPIIKETPKGCWIDDYGKKRFILSNSRKKYAYPTKEEARLGFLKRSLAYKRILFSRLEEVEMYLRDFPIWEQTEKEKEIVCASL